MDKIIFSAIKEFNLSSSEEIYLDTNNRLRARGFFYDEFVGVELTPCGTWRVVDVKVIEKRDSIRKMLGIAKPLPQSKPIRRVSRKVADLEFA